MRSVWPLLAWWLGAAALFASGFLLARSELEQRSPLSSSPPPPAASRLLLLVVDALGCSLARSALAPRLPLLAVACLHADPPTVTAQRLKARRMSLLSFPFCLFSFLTLCQALATGSLPTFVEAGRNFASIAVAADSWLSQARAAGKKVVLLGDDTWAALFPGVFDGNRSRPAESFDVRDLDTADNVVLSHLFGEIEQGDFDVLVAHFLGLDHAGHTFGPGTPPFRRKVEQMAQVLERVVSAILLRNQSDLLLVMGDHGMTPEGNHGGATRAETEAALLVLAPPSFSPMVFGNDPDALPSQIDLAPTLSGLLGLPVPFGNLGSPMPQFFSANRFRNLLRETEQQVRAYLAAYLEAHPGAFPENDLRNLAGKSGEAYLAAAAAMCRRAWATFDVPRMVFGICAQFLVLLCWASGAPASLSGLLLGAAAGPPLLVLLFSTNDWRNESALFAAGLLLGPLALQVPAALRALVQNPPTVGGMELLAVLQCLALFSNSFVEAERAVVATLLRSALLLLLFSPSFPRKPVAGLLASVTFLPMVGGNSTALLPGLLVLLAAQGAWPQSRARLLLVLGVFGYFFAKVWRAELFAESWLLRIALPRSVFAGSLFLPMIGGNAAEALEVWLLLAGGPKGLLASAVLVLQSRLACAHLSAFPQTFALFARFCFYESGRTASFAALDVESGFVGWDAAPQTFCGMLIAANALAPMLLAPRGPPRAARHMFCVFCANFFATCVFVCWERHHLMMWRVFAPKFVFEGAFMLAALANMLLSELVWRK